MNIKKIQQLANSPLLEINKEQRNMLVNSLNDIIPNTPRYREYISMLKSLDESNVVDFLQTLPIITKQEVMLNSQLFHRLDLPGKKYDIRTGGTSGEILSFQRIRSEYDVENMHLSYCWSTMEIQLGVDKGVVLTNRPPKQSLDGFTHLDRNNMLWVTCNGNTPSHWEKVYRTIDQFNPKYLRGYGSLVGEFFNQMKNLNFDFPVSIRSIAYSSDPIQPSELKQMRNVFPGKILSLYGQTERVTMGITCEYGNRFHLLPTYGYTEIIREDGSIIDGPNEIGQIISTSLYPRACSFVRYATGDLGCWVENKCPCGKHGPSISKFLQRSHEIVVNNKHESFVIGRRKSFLNFRDHLPVGVGVQFLQRTPGRLSVFLQTVEQDSKLYDLALSYLRTEFDVDVEFVTEPLLNKNGKRTLLIKEFES